MPVGCSQFSVDACAAAKTLVTARVRVKRGRMTRGLVFRLCISAVLAYGQAAASDDHSGDEQAIRRLNQEVLKAYNLGDVKTLNRVEDADFTLTDDFGEVTKAQQIDDVSHRKPNEERAPNRRQRALPLLWRCRTADRG